MASIPLLCNICPKHPDFSDISHLLTHVGSKGHLSHYFKAQVRSRQEPAVRQQLDIYDRWYSKYQIERLLSQRMVLKESKEIRGNSRNIRRGAPTPVSSSIAPRKAIRAPNARQRSPHDDKAGVIDPQLSLISAETLVGSPPPVPQPPSGELASRHRAYIPQMRQRGSLSPSRTPSIDSGALDSLRHFARKRHHGADNGNEFQEMHEQSPYKMTYPDPSTLSETLHARAFQISSAGVEQQPQNPLTESEVGKCNLGVHQVGLAQSPILKGVQWPGMNIFDSASPEAQRKRNQKKTTSIMAQMELNSSAVEPLERIYWPEGDLKKERIITGMVESSPMKEDSPRPKRRRQASSRTVLGDLSTNHHQNIRRPPTMKAFREVTASRDADLGDLSKRTLAMLDFSPYGDPMAKYSRPGIGTEDEIEWKLNAGNSMERADDFIIFHDETENELDDPISHATKYSSVGNCVGSKDGELDGLNHDFTPTPSISENSLSSRTGRLSTTSILPQSGYYPTIGQASWMPTSNKENLEPILDHTGRADHEAAQLRPERTTQRYFYTKGAHPPEFFDFMPPQMEFGGLVDSRFSGSSRNPLIPTGRCQYGPYFGDETRSPALSAFQPVQKTECRRGTSGDLKFQ
jgi:hypothetical protein